MYNTVKNKERRYLLVGICGQYKDMGPNMIVDFILGGVISWLNEGVVYALQQAVNICGTKIMAFISGEMNISGKPVGEGFSAVFQSFFTDDFLNTLVNSFCWIGMALCVLMVIFGVIRNILSGLGFAGENPVKMILRWIVAVVMIWTINPIINICFKQVYTPIADGLRSISIDSNIEESISFSFSGVSSILGTVMVLVFGIMIIMNLFKLAVEIIERYLLCNVIIVCSPLLASSITLDTTMKVFQNTIKMVVGQGFIMLMNIVTIKLVTMSFNPLMSDLTSSSLTGADYVVQIFLDMIFILALLKIAQRFDNYMRDLGLLVGVTGGNLWGDIMSAAHSLGGMVSPVTKSVGKTLRGAIKGGGSAATAAVGGLAAGTAFSAAKAGGVGAATLNAVNSLSQGGLKNAAYGNDKNGNLLISGTDQSGNQQMFRMRPMQEGEAEKFKNGANQQAIVGQNGRSYAVENLTGKAAEGNAAAMSAEAAANKSMKFSTPFTSDITQDANGNVNPRAAAELITAATLGGVALPNYDNLLRSGSNDLSAEKSALQQLEQVYGANSSEITPDNINLAKQMQAEGIDITKQNMDDAKMLQANGAEIDPVAFEGIDALRESGWSDEHIAGLEGNDYANAGVMEENGVELTNANMSTARELNAVGVSSEGMTRDQIEGYQEALKNGVPVTSAQDAEAVATLNSLGGYDVNSENMATIASLNSVGVPTSEITADTMSGYSNAKENGVAINEQDDVAAMTSLSAADMDVTNANMFSARRLNDYNIPVDKNSVAGYNAAAHIYGDSITPEYVKAAAECSRNGIPLEQPNIENMAQCANRNGFSVGKFYANESGMTKYDGTLVSQYDSAIKYCDSQSLPTSNYAHAVVFARNSGCANPSKEQLDAINTTYQESRAAYPELSWNRFNTSNSKSVKAARNKIFGTSK